MQALVCGTKLKNYFYKKHLSAVLLDYELWWTATWLSGLFSQLFFHYLYKILITEKYFQLSQKYSQLLANGIGLWKTGTSLCQALVQKKERIMPVTQMGIEKLGMWMDSALQLGMI